MDDAESATEMKNAYGLEFPVLYDTDTSVATEYGLYDLLGDGVSAPATFIIRTDGTIESALIGTTINERPTPDSILDVLASLAGMDRAAMSDTADDARSSCRWQGRLRSDSPYRILTCQRRAAYPSLLAKTWARGTSCWCSSAPGGECSAVSSSCSCRRITTRSRRLMPRSSP